MGEERARLPAADAGGIIGPSRRLADGVRRVRSDGPDRVGDLPRQRPHGPERGSAALEQARQAAQEVRGSMMWRNQAGRRYLVRVSARGAQTSLGPESDDTIAIFEFKNGTADSGSPSCPSKRKRRMEKVNQYAVKRAGETLELLAQIPTGLQQIRSMSLGKVEDGSDEFIVAGANTVGGVAVLRRVDEGRSLELVTRNEELGNRTSFVFL